MHGAGTSGDRPGKSPKRAHRVGGSGRHFGRAVSDGRVGWACRACPPPDISGGFAERGGWAGVSGKCAGRDVGGDVSEAQAVESGGSGASRGRLGGAKRAGRTGQTDRAARAADDSAKYVGRPRRATGESARFW